MNTKYFKVDPRLEQLSDKAERAAAAAFAEIERVTEFNQQKVLSAYIRHRVSETHFNPTTGYGYGDQGRDALDEILADIMGAEHCVGHSCHYYRSIRHFASGRHSAGRYRRTV